MNPFILPLDDPRADLDTVGGKGMSLARMLGAGLPVPGGFHITTEAYRSFVSANALQERILSALAGVEASDPAGLEAASQTIAAWFSGLVASPSASPPLNEMESMRRACFGGSGASSARGKRRISPAAYVAVNSGSTGALYEGR